MYAVPHMVTLSAPHIALFRTAHDIQLGSPRESHVCYDAGMTALYAS
jgi:hypothetical protein